MVLCDMYLFHCSVSLWLTPEISISPSLYSFLYLSLPIVFSISSYLQFSLSLPTYIFSISLYLQFSLSLSSYSLLYLSLPIVFSISLYLQFSLSLPTYSFLYLSLPIVFLSLSLPIVFSISPYLYSFLYLSLCLFHTPNFSHIYLRMVQKFLYILIRFI